jgi:hypothetical protein
LSATPMMTAIARASAFCLIRNALNSRHMTVLLGSGNGQAR